MWISVMMHLHMRSYVIIVFHVWSYVNIDFSYMIIYGQSQLKGEYLNVDRCLFIHGYIWLYIFIDGYIWSYLYIHSHIWSHICSSVHMKWYFFMHEYEEAAITAAFCAYSSTSSSDFTSWVFSSDFLSDMDYSPSARTRCRYCRRSFLSFPNPLTAGRKAVCLYLPQRLLPSQYYCNYWWEGRTYVTCQTTC